MLTNQVQAETSAIKGPCEEKMETIGPSEALDQLAFLADVVLAPPCGRLQTCDGGGRDWWLERDIQSMRLQHQFLISEVDLLIRSIDNEQARKAGGAYSATVPSFLYTCQVYFNHVDTIIQNTTCKNRLQPSSITKLLDSTQQLCDQLERLLLTCASYNIFSLDETQPNNISHFCIGQSQVGQVKVTTFRYCKPTPYLARMETGLFKRMRWNVETLQGEGGACKRQAGDGEEGEAGGGGTEYYFLCYEDIPEADVEREKAAKGDRVERMWSIGKWVQVNPDPKGDITDWILCEVPQATYHRVLCLGSEEPSSHKATDYLKQLLVEETTD